jgi:hypothetical protein
MQRKSASENVSTSGERLREVSGDSVVCANHEEPKPEHGAENSPLKFEVVAEFVVRRGSSRVTSRVTFSPTLALIINDYPR